MHIASRLGQILGTLEDVGASGAHQDSRLSMGTPFILMQARSRVGNLPSYLGIREGAFSYSGGVLYWSGWDMDPATVANYKRTLIYGYY